MTQTATLGWVILYVPDVEMALGFYERAFGFKRGFVDEHASFGQLQTGETALSFATEERARRELHGPFRRASLDEEPFNIELCLVFDDPHEAFRHAIAAGCTAVAEPEPKPHGQVAGFVRDAFGNLVEIASPLRPRQLNRRAAWPWCWRARQRGTAGPQAAGHPGSACAAAAAP